MGRKKKDKKDQKQFFADGEDAAKQQARAKREKQVGRRNFHQNKLSVNMPTS